MVEFRDIITFIALALAIVNLSSNYHLSAGIGSIENSLLPTKRSVEAVLPEQSATITTLEGVVQELTQILMKYQSTLEQRIRFEGGSGVTEARGYGAGTQSYHQSTHNTLNIHDHADFIDTMGMGEFSAVLNGVEFTTRHNDYRLVMPAINDSTYHRTVPIPHPEVPPSVLAKATVQEQVAEMREYFRAFALQDASIRNYKPYFKAQLCYLEGTWIKDSATLTDPFSSDRHAIDAATWKILNEKYRFLMNNGQKNNLENLAWLPTAVRDTTEREDFDVKNIGSNSFKPTAETGSQFPIAKGIIPIANAPDQTLISGIFKRVEGNYLGVYNAPSTVDVVFRVNVTCGTDSTGQISRGCYSFSKAATCVGATNNCPITTATGKGSWLFTAKAGLVSGFLYGPLSAFHNITVTWENVTGITKYMFVSDPKGKNFTGNNKGFELTGNIFPATPVVANYEYRILCNPIEGDLPTDRFVIYEDNAAFVRDNKNKTTMRDSRRALFALNPKNQSKFQDAATNYEFIDELMEKIPGKNNHGCYLSDKSFGSTTQHYKNPPRELNVCYYSRFFSLSETDAMGRSQRRRGYNDPTLWAAMTTATNVVGQPVYDDVNQEQLNQKWSWAIPIEVVYMTPLTSWNPYNLKTWLNTDPSASVESVTAGGRFGGLNASNCYNGTSYKVFYRTPAEFFSPKAGESDPADTSNPEVKGVCDANGNVRRVYRSGHSCFLPSIDGLPLIRQRYPVFPLHNTKPLAYKETKAFEKMNGN